MGKKKLEELVVEPTLKDKIAHAEKTLEIAKELRSKLRSAIQRKKDHDSK